jgi:hypothetical protein
MTLLEELTAHKGRLILLKTELFWYGGRGWDGVHDRICLLMDARDADGDGYLPLLLDAASAIATAAAREARTARAERAGAVALLLIDGRPHWVWVSSDDLELL